MVHCGFEPSAVAATFGTWQGFWRTVRTTLLGSSQRRPPTPPARVPAPHHVPKELVQLQGQD
jgi:hypothetical protein